MALVIFDTETTSFTGDVVEFGSVIITDSGEKFHFNERCKPNEPIQEGAQKVHGISNEDVANCRPSHIVVQEWYNDVMDLREDLVFCAHNLQFDEGIIKQHVSLEHHKRFCSLYTARRLFPEITSKSLGPLYAHFGHILGEMNAHSALDDCIMLERVLPFLTKDYRAEAAFQGQKRIDNAKPPKLLDKVPDHFKNHGGKNFNDISEKDLTWFRDSCKNKDVAYTAGVILEQRK